MTLSVSSSEVVQWLKNQKSIEKESTGTILNINALVCLLIQNQIYDTSIGNYIFTVLSMDSKKELDLSIVKLLETLAIHGGHYTVSICIQNLEKFVIDKIFSALNLEMCNTLLNTVYFLIKYHSHLLSLKFVQCIGILVTDVLYSSTTSYYKLNNVILPFKTQHTILKCLQISFILLKNGHCFIDRVDRLSNYCQKPLGTTLNNDQSTPLKDCLDGQLTIQPCNDELHFQIIEMVHLLQFECARLTCTVDKVIVYEIIEYIQEIVDNISAIDAQSTTNVKRPCSLDDDNDLEVKKFKLNLEQVHPIHDENDARLNDLLTRYENNELDIVL